MDFIDDIDCLPEFPDSWMEQIISTLDNNSMNNANEEQVSPLVEFALTNHEINNYDQPSNVKSSSLQLEELSSVDLEALSSLHYEELITYGSSTPEQLVTYECYIMPAEQMPKQSTSSSMVQVPSADQSNEEIKSNTNTTLRELLVSNQYSASTSNKFGGATLTVICPECRHPFGEVAELNFHLNFRTASCENCEEKFCSKVLKDAHRRHCRR